VQRIVQFKQQSQSFIVELESRPGTSRLDAPWTEYSVEELLQWTMTRFCVDEFWHTPPETVSRIRKRSFQSSGGNANILLPDGRWFLDVDAFTGRVVTFDLDSAQPVMDELIS
jgi:hypothetical protein